MSLRALLVDDEILARERLKAFAALEPDLELVGECADGASAAASIEALAPDLVFLDIQLPELDGFQVIEAVGLDRMPPVLFVTAYDRHALKAFEVHAVDYLLKPFDRPRFQASLARARTWIQGAADAGRLAGLMESVQASRPPQDRILVRAGDRHLLLKVEEIQWIEAEDNYVRLHVEGTSHLVRGTMGGILQKLDPERFKRVHRSSIVNLDFVKELRPWFHGDYQVLLADGTRLTMPRAYRDQITRLK
ncbi:MAG TPA: LytTR family DNA-binding domain-containing protein [Holophagaceae bacterium]|nr:LytTR family DNA-binding domain-containing protein [Holophagaceae bacterium]